MLESKANPFIMRHQWVKSLMEILRSVREGRYHVKRGAINWSTFTWPSERAIAVRTPENFPPDELKLRQTTLEIIVATKIGGGEMQDDVLDEMESDVILAAAALLREKFSAGGVSNTSIVKMELTGSVEFNDLNLNIQGWFITFSVEY